VVIGFINKQTKLGGTIPSGKLTGRAVLGQLVLFAPFCISERCKPNFEDIEDISYLKER
jgi:hypothetical protein